MNFRAFTCGKVLFDSSFDSNACWQQLRFSARQRQHLTVQVSVLVQLLRRRNMRMSENKLHIPSRNAQVFKHRGCGVAGVVHGDPRQAGRLTNLMKRPNEVLWVNWRIGGAKENQSLVRSGLLSDTLTVGLTAMLLCVQIGEFFAQYGDEGEIPPSRCRLDRSLFQGRANALELLADVKLAASKVHIAPAQAEDFTAP